MDDGEKALIGLGLILLFDYFSKADREMTERVLCAARNYKVSNKSEQSGHHCAEQESGSIGGELVLVGQDGSGHDDAEKDKPSPNQSPSGCGGVGVVPGSDVLFDERRNFGDGLLNSGGHDPSCFTNNRSYFFRHRFRPRARRLSGFVFVNRFHRKRRIA